MTDLTPRQLALCVVGVVVMLLLGLSQLRRGGGESTAAGGGGGERAAPIAVEEDGGGGRLVVHVAGAVRDPGVYRLAAGARVDEAVARAGGATRRADLGGLNLAAELEDGRQVLVPERARAGSGAAGAAGGAGAAAPEPAPGQPLNLNTATLEQLDTLSGIGPLTAQKILEYREELGGFGSVEELGEIPGIGEKRLASLREEVTL
jgi:competence protein ComEA